MRWIAWVAGLAVIAFFSFEAYASWTKGDISTGALGGIAAGVFTLLTTESIRLRQAKPNALNQHDRDLFASFQASLPFDPTIKLLRDHDFSTDYQAKWLSPLNRFVETWDDPNLEFLEPELESAKRKLFKQAEHLAMLIAIETIPNDRNEGWRTVYPVNQRGGERPQHVRESAERANAGAKSFVPVYEEFVRLARKKLAT